MYSQELRAGQGLTLTDAGRSAAAVTVGEYKGQQCMAGQELGVRVGRRAGFALHTPCALGTSSTKHRHLISPPIAYFKNIFSWDFPGGTVVKNPPANAGDTDSIPGPGRSHMPRSN